MSIVKRRLAATLFILAAAVSATAGGAQEADKGCAGRMTEQLRRFNETCLNDVVRHLSGSPKGSARIWNENEKYYIKLTRAGADIRAEAVSKYNYPLMKEETERNLKSLGWAPPEHEFGDFTKSFSSQEIADGTAARELDKALRAYGMSTGEAMSLTVASGE